MDTRKVLEMGGGTVLISLPKSWAKKNGIVRGSSVAVEEISARRLIIKPIEGGGERADQGTVIGYPGESLGDVINDITGAYLTGSNSISVRGGSVITREDRARLKAAVMRLVGLEIVEEDAKGMTMQFLPDPTVLAPEKMVRRMASLLGGMLRDSAEGVRRDRALLGIVGERDDEVDRLYFLLVRTIRTAAIDPEAAERYDLAPIECMDYRVLASYLESVGDAVTDFARRASAEEFGREVGAQLARILGTLEKMGEVAIASFLARRRVQSRRAHSEVASMREVLGALSKEVAAKGAPVGAMVDLLALLERVASVFVDISDLALPAYQLGQE